MSRLNVLRAGFLYRDILRSKKVSEKFLSTLANREAYVGRNEKDLRTSTLAGPVRDGNILYSPYGEADPVTLDLTNYVFQDNPEFGHLPAISCGVTDRTYTYLECREMITKFAEALLSVFKMKKGDTVGLILPNIPEFIFVIFGSISAGLRVTFANPLYTSDEIARQFINSDVKTIVAIDALAPIVKDVRPKLKDYMGTVFIGENKKYNDNTYSLQSLLTSNYDVELPKIDLDSVAIVPYSSGTTGLPKGVMLTHKNLVTNISQLMNPAFRVHKEIRGNHQTILTVPPFFHIYGFNSILNFNLLLKKHLISIPKFTPENYLKCLEMYRPQTLFVVPSLLAFLSNHPKVTREHLSCIESITVGAAPITDSITDKFLRKAGKDKKEIKIQQGYGMTESSPCIILTPFGYPESKGMSVGQIVAGTECKVVSITTGENLGTYKPGELMCRGPQVMKGYLKNEAATRETIDEDGWLHTGDIAYYDDDHYFYIVDRTKELIKVKGNQVSPTELENIIMEIPNVADAAVVGIADTLAGELPKAFIVTKEGKTVTEKQIYDWVAAKVTKYKRLEGGIVFIKAIPRNPGGKVLRNELKLLK